MAALCRALVDPTGGNETWHIVVVFRSRAAQLFGAVPRARISHKRENFVVENFPLVFIAPNSAPRDKLHAPRANGRSSWDVHARRTARCARLKVFQMIRFPFSDVSVHRRIPASPTFPLARLDFPPEPRETRNPVWFNPRGIVGRRSRFRRKERAAYEV